MPVFAPSLPPYTIPQPGRCWGLTMPRPRYSGHCHPDGRHFAVILVYWVKIRSYAGGLPTERQAQRFALNVFIVRAGRGAGAVWQRPPVHARGGTKNFHDWRLLSSCGPSGGRLGHPHPQRGRHDAAGCPGSASVQCSQRFLAPAAANTIIDSMPYLSRQAATDFRSSWPFPP